MPSSSSTKGVQPSSPGVQPNMIALHTICLFLVTVCVGIRLYTRKFINHYLGIDDCSIGFCALAYILTLILSGLVIWGLLEGLGLPMWDVPASKYVAMRKALSISESIYMPLVASIKLSCLLFYRRIFSPSRTTIRFVDGGIIVISSAYIAIFFTTVFECIPFSKRWDDSAPGYCMKDTIVPYTSGAINALSDIYVLILPIPCIWGLNISLSRKLQTLALFGLGILVCATSVVRLGMTSRLESLLIYAVLEVNVGIICASLLAFPAFLERHGSKCLGSFFHRLFLRCGTWIETRFSRLRSSRWAITISLSGRDPACNPPLDPGASEFTRLREKNHSAETDMSVNRDNEHFAAHQPSYIRPDGSSDNDVEAGIGAGKFQTVYPIAAKVPKRDAYERAHISGSESI